MPRRLARLRTPTLVILGNHDRVRPARFAAEVT